MRTFIWILSGLAVGVMAIYAFGCWVLGDLPWHFWREQIPDMYDGKGSYEEWAAQMEMARRLQAKEEEE